MPSNPPRPKVTHAMRARIAVTSALVFLSLAGPLRAQVPFDPGRNQALGAVAGVATGAGVSYQEILPSAFGFRGTLLGWKIGDSSFVDVGAAGLRVLSDDGRRRLYLIGGASYWRWDDEDGEGESWSAGLGAGGEFPLSARTIVALEGVFTYWDETGDFLPLPQIAVYYLF
jgi:hypothetical protein